MIRRLRLWLARRKLSLLNADINDTADALEYFLIYGSDAQATKALRKTLRALGAERVRVRALIDSLTHNPKG